VLLRSADGQTAIPISARPGLLQRLAKHWHYVLRTRRRWIDDPALRETIEQRARDHLQAVGVGPDALAYMVRSGLIEVSVAYQPGGPQGVDTGWEGRLLPWEHLLSAAARRYRGGRPFLVVRHLRVPAAPPPLSASDGGLFIHSAPGGLRGRYNFETEGTVLSEHLGDALRTLDALENPTVEGIRRAAGKLCPRIVHLSGWDSFQGMRILDPEQKTPVATIRDGAFLRDDAWKETMVESYPLAEAITAGAMKPAIASFNLYYSSARTAAFAVALGAGSALAFQDTVEDIMAEIFFANFYLHLAHSGFRPLVAFRRALEPLAAYKGRLHGTGIVLWSSQPLTPVPADFNAHVELPLRPENTAQRLSRWVRAEIAPRPKLNYAVLHNGRRPLFSNFSIYRLRPHALRDLEVEVELRVGGERFPYKRTLEMTDHVVDLADQIGVGLTSRLARSLQEAVRTTLHVRIARREEQLRSETMQVSLLPVNEWRDDDASRPWLPSFVLPRDPAVLKIIVAAQRYLMAIEDDANAGFDGYQSLNPGAEEPAANVDAQVRAVWYALLHRYALNYINPPPTFTSESQRLRTPSDVLQGRRGTCIDLALTLAACLEYIGIYPVIFLLEGHAFPGYWRNHEARDELRVTRPPLVEDESTPTPLPDEEVEEEAGSYVQRYAWEFDRSRYGEVLEAVRGGDIVPLETTLLTNRGGFWEAVEEGIRNLDSAGQFHSMLDIGLAREGDVTPLPLAAFDGE